VAEPAQIPWQEIDPLEPVDGDVSSVLATVDTLRGAWEDFITTVSAEEFAEARQRSLRRHAIETGIIERLYDVDWGVTEALVAEGLVREVAEREGGIDDDAFETIRAQFDALEFLAQAAREARPVTVFFIQQLHELITRHQTVYEAVTEHGHRVVSPNCCNFAGSVRRAA
jgi:glycine/D-amino acid oxidase-like deaminating enzyme